MTNTELLNRKIDESGYKRQWIAEQLGLTKFGLLKKIRNETEFKVAEMLKLCKILDISEADRDAIFFCENS